MTVAAARCGRCGAEDLTLNQLATRVHQVAGRMQPLRHVPRWLLRKCLRVPTYRPQVARFAEAGLAMDTLDFTIRAQLASSLNGLSNGS